MTKTEQKHAAQDRLLGRMADAILCAEETGDTDMAAEMRQQAQRVMRLFGVTQFNGL